MSVALYSFELVVDWIGVSYAPIVGRAFEKVSRLVDGFESPQDLELLATVHWLNKYEQARNTDQVIEGVHSWNTRKQQLTTRKIAIAEKVLGNQHCLSA